MVNFNCERVLWHEMYKIIRIYLVVWICRSVSVLMWACGFIAAFRTECVRKNEIKVKCLSLLANKRNMMNSNGTFICLAKTKQKERSRKRRKTTRTFIFFFFLANEKVFLIALLCAFISVGEVLWQMLSWHSKTTAIFNGLTLLTCVPVWITCESIWI